MPPIECLLGFAETPVGNDTYVFNRDKHGRYVANVANLKHVQILLSRPEVYRELRDEALSATALTPLEEEIEVLADEDFEEHPATEEEEAALLAAAAAANAETLLGSSILPAMVAITPDLSVQLGDVVARAHKDSELSVEAWNALPEADREELLVQAVLVMQKEAAPEPEPTVPEDPVTEPPTTEPPTTEPPTDPAPPKEPEDLAVIKGIGVGSAKKLQAAGILYVAQLASLTAAEMAELDAKLKLNGMSVRNDWPKLAADHLASGA